MKVTGWLVWISLCACTVAPPEPPAQDLARIASPACVDTELAWGSAANQVGLLPAVPEGLARGPQAVAVAPNGDVIVLDAVNRRVLAIDSNGVRIVATGIARDAEDLAVGSDGAFAVFSPLQSRAWMFEATGAPAGEVAVDRALRHVAGMSIGPSRQLLLRSAYQETFVAGSPAAPVALPTTLAGKREGAFLLADGRGVATRAVAGSAQLIVKSNPSVRRSTTSAVHAIPGDVSAALAFGAAGDLACMRVERVEQQEQLIVLRRAVCMDATNGRTALDMELPPPGIYLPRQELAIGGTVTKLAFLHATADHLVVRTCEVSR